MTSAWIGDSRIPLSQMSSDGPISKRLIFVLYDHSYQGDLLRVYDHCDVVG